MNAESNISLIQNKLSIFATRNKDILAVLLVGSYARNKQHEKSDIDIMVITTDEMKNFSDYNWIKQFAETDVIEKKIGES